MHRALLLLVALGACKTPARHSEKETAEKKAALDTLLAEVPSCARPMLHAPPESPERVDLDKRFALPADCKPLYAALLDGKHPVPAMDLLQITDNAACVELVGHIVQSAVSHDVVCAPPMAASAPDTEGLVAFAKMIALRVQWIAQKDPFAALTLALDGIRFYQDSMRGSGTLIQAMIAITSEKIILDNAALALGPFVNDDANRRALDQLLATQPSMHDVLVAETQWSGRQGDIAAINRALATYQRWTTACPAGGSVHACLLALQKLTTTEDDKSIVDYPPKFGQALFRLAALRFQLEATQHACPSTTDLGLPPWREILDPAALGDRIDAQLGDTSYTLVPPAWLGKEKPVLIGCPAPSAM